MWNDIKDRFWAVVGPVGSIIEARLTMIFGFITSVVGLMDWSPLLNLFGESTAFTKAQVLAIGAITFIKGVAQEITRRYNDPLLTITAAVKDAPEVAEAKKKVKKIVAKTPPVTEKK